MSTELWSQKHQTAYFILNNILQVDRRYMYFVSATETLYENIVIFW